MGGMLRFARLALAFSLGALGPIAVGVRPAVSHAPAHGDGRAGPAASIRWRSCGARLDCARVRVPFDWARPGGPRISLQVVRHRASRRGGRIGSLFVNGGGAAGSEELVRTDGARLDALGRGRFDVVGWALRGTPGATPMVRCFAREQSRARLWDDLPIPTTWAEGRPYLRRTIAYARGCATLSGRLPAHVSTTDDARDLDRLRRLVGDRTLTYWAVSYGTFLGQTYANLYPRHVRAMVLDGLVDPRVVMKGAAARFSDTAMEQGLRRFESLCERAGPRRCALAGGGAVARRVARLLARLRRAPVPAPDARPAGPLRYGDVLLVLFATLTNPAGWPQLASDLDAADRGDGSALATQARAALTGIRSAPGDSQTAISCADSPAREGPRAWRAVMARMIAGSRIGGPFAWTNWARCASWTARATDRYTGPWNAATKTPVLVVGTRFDPATPYAGARRVAGLLGNAVLLTHDGYGHTSEADPSTCVVRATRAYLVRLTTPRKGTVCASDRQPFAPGFGR